MKYGLLGLLLIILSTTIYGFCGNGSVTTTIQNLSIYLDGSNFIPNCNLNFVALRQINNETQQIKMIGLLTTTDTGRFFIYIMPNDKQGDLIFKQFEYGTGPESHDDYPTLLTTSTPAVPEFTTFGIIFSVLGALTIYGVKNEKFKN